MAFTFNRGIKPEFVKRLNKEYDQGGWWRAIASDPTLFIAIRENYLNVYWKGNSLLKLVFDGSKLVGEIHYKYLLKGNVKQPYIRTDENGRVVNLSPSALFQNDLSNLGALKRAADAYAGDEKAGVHCIVMKNPSVVDVEIAFRNEATEEKDVSTPRIDFAALRATDEGAEIVFYEAKLFSNKEVRAKGISPPPVAQQIEKYGKFLTEHPEVVSSYRRVCGNLAELKGVCTRYPKETLNRMLQISSPKTPLSVVPSVQLVIFGYDRDQDKGAVWTLHRKKLQTVFGDRLHLIGNAQGLRL